MEHSPRAPKPATQEASEKGKQKQPDKQERLAHALRQNLLRRKMAARPDQGGDKQ